ncbi:hypothetical protein AB0K00_53975 [Dactylosporangium sp. NPDC049525]|uniref:hypothetical protein n=1 Tax=Dactylosporangium sp. NPDC049525 TaxID=3154730 RepID=UPI003438ED55
MTTYLFTAGTAPLAASAGPAMLRVDQPVHVNVRAAWFAATVTSVARTRVGVTFHPTPGMPLGGVVAPWAVRAAAGIRLRPVRQLRAGDEVVAGDGAVHLVAAAWPGRGGWWIVGYDGGQRSAVPGNAVLRLVEPTPTVTCNGVAI